MARNYLALYGLHAFLKENEELHNQVVWGYMESAAETVEGVARAISGDVFSCGTTACVAGWASLLSGDRPEECDLNPIGGKHWVFSSVITPNGDRQDIPDRAAEILGIGEDLAEALFYGVNLPHKSVLHALKMLMHGKSEDKVVEYLVYH